MEILINSYEPRLDVNGQPDSYQINNVNYFPYVVNYSYNGQNFIGEASVKNTPPRWKPGETWSVTMTQDEKAAGGVRLKGFSRPYDGNTTATAAPQYGQPTVSAPPPQKPVQTTTAPSKGDQTQALIVAQSSMKAAVQYVSALSEPERVGLNETLKASGVQVDGDIISKYADKIAKETISIARNIAPML